ncbi:sensor histidine kinase [Kitasatospora sp. NBC_01287]|uniref:sensor histidine kinase n=1 Tax=Kitasatospora sp. NBC_01287 TaxID=2903573 RepID=UPI002259E6C1|nr:sensor histidine kinase [Kitasatospora sp. NBC_01287]MCX4747740.1 sensor histidine kinase [Kitasatospora sp. NBC_01287]
MNLDETDPVPARPADRSARGGAGTVAPPEELLAVLPAAPGPLRLDGEDGTAQRLLSQEPEVLARYLAGLRAINSPLAADPEAWEQCVVQARRILMDCAVSLAEGRATVTGTEIAEVVNLGGERLRQGLHLTHSIRAGMLLLDIVLSALATAVAEAGQAEAVAAVGLPHDPAEVCATCGAPARWAEELAGAVRHSHARDEHYTAALRSLQEGVSRRLEVGSVGYDTFLLSRVRELHELGRRKLAREIHDQLGNSLSLAMRQLELHELRSGDDISPHVKAAKAAVLEAMDTTRQMVTELRRSNVSGSLEMALKGFAASMAEAGGRVQIWVKGSDEWVPSKVSEELFIIIRECLRNALRHAEAGNIVVHIDIAPHEVQAEVLDDGRGFDPGAVGRKGTSNGLDGMRERVQLLHGTVNISSTPGKGTQVLVWIPIEGAADEEVESA